jgi:dTDP-L-rhamnose 4-epimerase
MTPELTGKYRVGDIRHCFADITRARQLIGYEPQTSFVQGVEELAGWLSDQESAVDRVEAAREELAARGLAL